MYIYLANIALMIITQVYLLDMEITVDLLVD